MWKKPWTIFKIESSGTIWVCTANLAGPGCQQKITAFWNCSWLQFLSKAQYDILGFLHSEDNSTYVHLSEKIQTDF